MSLSYEASAVLQSESEEGWLLWKWAPLSATVSSSSASAEPSPTLSQLTLIDANDTIGRLSGFDWRKCCGNTLHEVFVLVNRLSMAEMETPPSPTSSPTDSASEFPLFSVSHIIPDVSMYTTAIEKGEIILYHKQGLRSKIKFRPDLGCLVHILNVVHTPPEEVIGTSIEIPKTTTPVLSTPTTPIIQFEGHKAYEGLRERLETAGRLGDNVGAIFMALAVEGDVDTATNMRLVYANQKGLESYAGVGEHAPLGKTLRDLSPLVYLVEYDSTPVPELYRRVAATKKPLVIRDTQLYKKVPSPFSNTIFDIHVVPLFDLDIACLFIVNKTDTHLRQRKLLQQNTAFAVAPDAVFIVDMHNTRIVYANPSALQLVKCAGDSTSVEGMLATDLMPKLADHFRVLPFSNDAANVAAHKWTGRTEITCLDGSLTLVDVDLSAMGPVDRHDEGHGITVVYARDISRTLQSEAELNQAIQANAAKTAFLSNMSHEIRTPLNGIIGYTQILQMQQDLSSEHREYLRGIDICSQALLVILNDLLDLAKIEANKMDLTVQPFDLFKCIDPAMDIISTGARQKSLQVGYTIDPSTPQIAIGDIGRLRQVLINLLTNAVKFTPAGGQTELKIKATRFDPDKHRHLRLVEYEYETIKDNNFHQEDFVLTFSVTDSGIGIKNPDGLFQPFMQEDNSVTRNYEGTGLGLAICKKLVELMGGRIWVKSSPGVGSAFSFEIPIPCVLQTKKESQRQQTERAACVLAFTTNPFQKRIMAGMLRLYSDRIALLTRWGSQQVFMTYHVFDDPSELEAYLKSNPIQLEDVKAFLVDMEVLQTSETQRALEVIDQANLEVTKIGFNAALLSKPEWIDYNFFHILQTPPKYFSFKAALSEALGIHMQEYISLVAPPQEGTPRPFPVSPDPSRFTPSSSIKVLIVEDNPINQKISRLLLSKLGIVSEVANDGAEALEMLTSPKAPFDIVFMDIQMPVMSGWEASARIRQMQLPVTPLVIAATAATTISDREKSLQHMDDFISKPISLQNLKGTLERVWLKSGRAPLSFAQDEQPGAPSNSQGGSPTPVIRRPASARRLEVQLAAEAAAIKDQTRIVYSLLFIIGLLCSALLAVIAKPVLA